jgi:pyruvate/2-oxoglutarate dehydrogenase complex dihydrolipoamide acyltransferase (E2) component
VFTDKLVAKIPSTHNGVIKKINFKTDDICLVGHALMELETEESKSNATPTKQHQSEEKKVQSTEKIVEKKAAPI